MRLCSLNEKGTICPRFSPQSGGLFGGLGVLSYMLYNLKHKRAGQSDADSVLTYSGVQLPSFLLQTRSSPST